MLQNLLKELNKYKIIGIFGYGKEGKSFFNFIKKYLPKISLIIIDKKNGYNYLLDLKKAELIIKSPGISLHNLNISYKEYNFTSSTELFLKYYKKQIIGITGTKGKSTLSTLIYQLFKNSNKDVILCGNIGIPIFDIIDNIKENSYIILELSSHQLYNIKYSPYIGILINIFAEHLDYYKDINEYFNSKMNIFKFQDKEDIGIINLNKIPNKYKNLENRIIDISKNTLKYNISPKEKYNIIHKDTLLILEYISSVFKIESKIYKETVENFKTLEHRLEYISTINEIDIINDSISTIPETAIEAIKKLKNVNTIILGGFNRGIDYKILVDFLINKEEVKNIILLSTTGKIILELLNKNLNNKYIYFAENLKDAIKKSLKITKKNSILLFSPASPSFDKYKNFEERGEIFKKIIFSQE